MRGAVVGIVLLSLGLARHALAQSPDPEALTKHGLALRRERRDAEALEDFRRAYAIRPAPRTLAQIAFAEQALGLWVNAEADLLRSMQQHDDPWIERHRQMLRVGLAEIQTHLGSLEVDVDVSGAELWVNGARVASLPLAKPLRVETGSAVIEVKSSGYAVARRLTSVEPGETTRETIHLVPLVAPEPAARVASPLEVTAALPLLVHPTTGTPTAVPPAPEGFSHRPMRAASFVLLGAAAVGLVAGGYFGIRTLAAKSDRDAQCGPRGCTWEGKTFDGEARSLAERSTAWFVFGTIAAGGGIGLLWISRTYANNPTTARIGLDVGPRGACAVLEDAW